MKKALKIIARSLYGIIEWLLLFVILFAFAIRTSPVQTYLAGIATDYLSKELGTTISIEKLDVIFIDKVDLKGVLLLNKNQSDTIANIKSLLVNVDGIGAFMNKIHLNSVSLEGGVVKIEKDETGEMNLKFIIDYFKSDKPKKKKTPPVIVDKVFISGLRFHYNNNAVAQAKEGMDYQHLLLSEIELDARKIRVEKGVIKANVRKLAAKEKSGFQLDHFTAKLKVSNKGVDLKEVNIKTPLTDLNSKRFKMIYSSYTQFKSFVDSVAFDADLHTSSLSFSDVAIFAPQLMGMDQQVEIEGRFTKFVKDLKAEDFILKTGKHTELRGTINLPDFRDLKHAFYQERITYAYVDLNDIQSIKLPNKSSNTRINLDPNVNRLGHIEAHDIRLDGIYSQFVVSSDEVKTSIGSANLDNGILFTYNPVNNSFLFTHSEASEYDVKINQFNLGKFLDNSIVGIIDGTFFLQGEAFSFSDIHFDKILGDINRFDLADYSYSDIKVKEAKFVDKVITAEVDVEDKNLLLNYNGEINLNGEPTMNMTIRLRRAFLNKLHITESDSTNLTAKIVLNTTGINPNTMSGTASMDSVLYVEGNKRIWVPKLELFVQRNEENDVFKLTSNILTAEVIGNINFNNIGDIVLDQLGHIAPGLIKVEPEKHQKYHAHSSTDFVRFDIKVIDLSSVMNIFVPDLTVSSGTKMNGFYDAQNKIFDMTLTSDMVTYKDKVAREIKIKQEAKNDVIAANYYVRSLNINDSIRLDSVLFVGDGNGNNLASSLTWNPSGANASEIKWLTQIESESKFDFTLEPSYFSINKHVWNIEKEAKISLDSLAIDVTSLMLSSHEQKITINGRASDNDRDVLNFNIIDLDLSDLGQMLGLNIALEGKVNGVGFISNPFNNLTFTGRLNAQDLAVDNTEVGNVNFESFWNNSNESIDLKGDLTYKGTPTFNFNGKYFVKKESNNLDFNLVFNQTNIAFANVFMDPLVVDNIKGFVNGELKVTGSPSRPVIEGTVNLDNAGAKIVMLGTSFTFNGSMYSDKDGFYIDYMPITDAEGNTGSFNGSILHKDFKNWNFDVSINIDEDYYRRDPKQSWVKLPLDRFLVMNTDGKNGEIYYGKAYATGTVGIFGYLDNLDVNVDVKTQRGTWINLSFFGQSELSEDNFIEFVNKDTIIDVKPKINFSGVSLNMNFDVTQDAQIKVIINEQTGDEITASGDGKLRLKLDNIGQMTLDGTYAVKQGSKYNFVLGPIKETFYVDGGSISWTGNPYQANLDLRAYYGLNANLGDLSPELLVSGNQEIKCFLNLTESLMKPAINFDIKAPKAPEQDKALLSTLIATDKDELNRQFFSLLLWKKFQPMKGSSRASSGAALDLASSQINALLGQLSKDYEMNVDMTKADVGESYEFGIKKRYGQFVVSGSFGVRNSTAGQQNHSSIIGDVEVEYMLNKDETFRINVFNESNDNRVLQSNNRGQFKQGIGVYYKEDFNNFKDFKLYQQFLDIFRKKGNKRYPIRRKREQTPVPK